MDIEPIYQNLVEGEADAVSSGVQEIKAFRKREKAVSAAAGGAQ